jgi:hypothetical protein
MKQSLIIVFLCVFISACSYNSTITRGIKFGMTPDEVVAKVEPSQKIVSRDGTRVVTEGFDRWGSERRNIYIFQNGKLVVHENEPIANR